MIQPYDADGMREADAHEIQQTGPIFADPTGQRRRLMRVLGAGASVLLVAALIMAGIGLFGGPDTPFSMFRAPVANGHGHQGTTGNGDKGGSGGHAPGTVTSSPPGSSRAHSRAPSATPTASASRDPSPTPTPSSSPAPTNRAGKTPPGQSRSRTPHPSPSHPSP